MRMRRGIIAMLLALATGVIVFAVVWVRRSPTPRLTIHVKAEPPVHLFTNAPPEVVKRYLSNAYELVAVDLKNTTNISEADVEQLRNAVAGKAPFFAKCSSIEFIDHKEAVVITRNMLGMEEHFLFEKSKSRWELIHKRSGYE